MQLTKPLLQLLEFLLILFVIQCGRKVNLRELLHLDKRELFIEGLPDIPALFQALVDHVDQQLQRIPGGNSLLVSVHHMPFHSLVSLIHELVIGLPEELILLVLPEIILRHAPFSLIVLSQGVETLALFILIDMQE